MAERRPAAHVMPLSDEFSRTLAAATETYGGTVFHMAGDGIMAGFGVEEGGGNGAREGLAAGHAMLQDFAPVAARWRGELSIEAGNGGGPHLGEVAGGGPGPPPHTANPLGGGPGKLGAPRRNRRAPRGGCFSCT